MKTKFHSSIALVTAALLAGFSSVPTFAAVTREEPVRTETSSDGKVTTSTYADGSQTTYNKETGVYELAGTSSSSSSGGAGWSAAGGGTAAAGTAAGTAAGWATAVWAGAAAGEKKGGWSFVYVTEKIPGANCEPFGSWSTQTTRLYKCPVGSGFDTVVGALGSLIKYATYLTGLIGVLMIVLSGIQYSLSGGGEDAKKAKGRIMQLVAWLVLLFLTGLILNTVAPWIYM